IGIVRWPLSVLRLQSADRDALLRVADAVFKEWRGFRAAPAGNLCFSGGAPRHTGTAVARFCGGACQRVLVLRQHRTSEAHPEGIFHPHRELHHIKKENIGLIEVMGLAVLPGRLQEETAAIARLLTGETAFDAAALAAANHPLNKHAEWIEELVRD